MGGSLFEHGGQNPIEPLSKGCFVLSGQYINNFSEIYEDLENLSLAKVFKEKNKLKNNGIKISPKGIKNLKFSSNVNEFVIHCMLLKKKLNPKIVPNMKRFFLYGFFL